MERDVGRDADVNIIEIFSRWSEYDDTLHSETYHLLSKAIEGRSTLNLNGAFGSFGPYSAQTRREALALVFRLVHSSPIETLLLQRNGIEDSSWEGGLHDVIQIGISELPNIKILNLSHNRLQLERRSIGLVGSTRFGIFPGLLSLSLSRNPVDMKHLRPSLKILSSLETLHVSSILSLDALDFLSSWKDKSMVNLQEIDLSGNYLSDEAMAALSKFRWPHLRRLNLSNSQMGRTGCALLAEAIRLGRLRALESIDLAGNSSADPSLANPVKDLEIRFGVTGLRVESDGVVFKIAEAITAGHLQFLKILNLWGILSVTDSSMVFLARSFCSGLVPLIEELNFDSSGFGEEGTVGLAEAIKSGNLTFLQKLALSGNGGMTDKAFISLAASFESGQAVQLRELVLTNVGLTDNGVKHLAKAINSGNLTALQKLDLSYNRTSEEYVVYLVDALRSGQARQLIELGLPFVGLWDKCLAKLLQMVDSENLKSLETVQSYRMPFERRTSKETNEGRKATGLKLVTDLPRWTF